MKKRGTAGLLGGALAVVLLAAMYLAAVIRLMRRIHSTMTEIIWLRHM